MKKILLSAAFLTAFFIPTFAKISFENPDINSRDEIVFTLDYQETGLASYKSVFFSKLQNDIPGSQKDLISYYPERMELLSLMNKNVLQIRNRFGTARYYSATDSISWTEQKNDIPLSSCTTTPYEANSEGKWFCYIEKTTTAMGKLILENTSTGNKIELCSDVLLTYNSVPVKWSKDGTILVYEKNGFVYFCSPDALNRGVEVEEKYRRIGRGSINSVEWASEKYLIYIDDYIVYKISSRELYTTGLYSDIIGQGTAIGRLPFQFSTTQDNFSVNNDATALVVAQNRKNFTYFKTLNSSCDFMDILYAKPYTDSSAALSDYSVFWNKKDEPVLWLEKLPYNSTKVQGSVIKLGENSRAVLEIEDSGKPVISPDNRRVAFFAGNTLYIYDISSWERIATLSGEKIVNVLWENNSNLYVGGTQSIRKWNITTDKSEPICISSAETAFWDTNTNQIVAQTSNQKKYYYIPSSGKWDFYTGFQTPKYTNQNGKYRAYCGTTPNTAYENSLYIRTLSKKAVTKPLFPSSTKKVQAKQKVALVFDAYDNADGLPKIISSLSRFNVPGTFFINGEFIRRYPSQTKQIALNGYQCGSLFFTTANLTDNSFIMDSNFIARGLGRNEDEFFQCTGKELSLYWHAPYYESNKMIEEAGNEAGYEYVPSIHIHSDNISLRQIEEGKTYLPPEKLIEEYVDLIKATKGGVIPVTVGVSQGGRPENLWEHIDLLINILVDENFELVSVSQL